MIRRHKFVPRYFGPLRVEGIAGTVVYCYDLSSGKSKKINMERCLPADALNEDDNPNLSKAYPVKSLDNVEEEEECLLKSIYGNNNAQSISTPNVNNRKNINKRGAATVRPKKKAIQKVNRTGAATSRGSKYIEAK